MKKTILIVLFLGLLLGCVTARHREYIRNGMLVTGLTQKAFLKEWGPPDKTGAALSHEYTQFRGSWGDWGGGAGFFRGRSPLDVWTYEKREVRSSSTING